MRSITTKAICTLLLTALVLGLAYWAITAPPAPELSVPSTGTTTAPTTVPTITTTPHSHLYTPQWHSDEEFHWTQCDCGEKSAMEPHADSDKNGVCDACGYTMEIPHAHSFSQTWLFDENDHWHICDCGLASNTAPHADTDANGKCDVCDADVAPPPHEHSFGAAWKSDETNHWNVCDCGEAANTAPHSDANRDGKAMFAPMPYRSPSLRHLPGSMVSTPLSSIPARMTISTDARPPTPIPSIPPASPSCLPAMWR